MTEKDYQRKKNKWLPKIHAWYISNFELLKFGASWFTGIWLIEVPYGTSLGKF